MCAHVDENRQWHQTHVHVLLPLLCNMSASLTTSGVEMSMVVLCINQVRQWPDYGYQRASQVK